MKKQIKLVLLSSPLQHVVPNNIQSGLRKNYSAFNNPAECIKIIQFLLNHGEKEQEQIDLMKANNRLYYENHLKPVELIKQTLIVAGII